MNGIERTTLGTHAMGSETNVSAYAQNSCNRLSADVYDSGFSVRGAHIGFKMVVQKGASTRLPNAAAKVQIISDGRAEDMIIVATALKTSGKGQENPQRM